MHQLKILLDKKDLDVVQPLLHEHITWGWEEEDQGGHILMTIYFDQGQQVLDFKAQALSLRPNLKLLEENVPAQDWKTSWQEFFTPIDVENRFLILPNWLHNAGQDRITLSIIPKMAFGTGHHATTYLCLQAISRLFDQGLLTPKANFLDLGSGSGILGIACAKLGMTGLGLDIDPVAVENAQENIQLNQVRESFQVQEGNLSVLPPDAQYDLILGNILSSTLKHMAPDIVKHLTQQGVLILSGILEEQALEVSKCYQNQGLNEPLQLQHEEWSALIWTLGQTAHESHRVIVANV